MWRGAPSQSFSNAQKLRENMTKAEKLLWDKLKNNQFHGLKFRRQHPVNKYIADFYCHKLELIIEIDGEYHNTKTQKVYDDLRTQDLSFQDIKVMRFTNDEVENEMNKVLKSIELYLKKGI